MVRRDYILRMIEQIGVAWAALVKIAGLRASGQYEQVAVLLEQVLRQHLGFGGDTPGRLSADELIALVRLGQTASIDETVITERLLLLGAILRERAELSLAQGRPDEAADFAAKALRVDLTVLVEEEHDDERARAALTPLLDLLADYEVPRSLKEQLWRYHERQGDFASAENWLFALLEDEPAVLPEGIAFYERLAALPDEALRRGDLPRDEVAAALAELRARAG
jgi:tetratricopeptide (TPR) repeat protein